MNTIKKWNILFVKQEQSVIDSDTQMFKDLFIKVDKASNEKEALSLFEANQYDMIIGDITVDPEAVVLLKQIKDKKAKQTVFALVDPKDTEKLYQIANYDINAFELTSDQFDQALEAIAEFNPYE